MARFVLPVFNLTANVWAGNSVWAPGLLPRNVLQAQLTVGPISLFQPAGAGSCSMLMKMPKLSLILDAFCIGGFFDYVEVPAASGRWYSVLYVDDYGKGFANEHRFAILTKSINKNTGLAWPVPIP